MTTYYTPSGWPVTASRGVSSLGRNECALIAAGFATVNSEMITKGAIAGQAWTGAHNFTGAVVTVANQSANDNSTKAANTAYVDTGLALKGAIAGQAWVGTQNFTGATITVPTQAANDSSTKAASTAFVMGQATLSAITAASAASTLANADNAQTWNWALTTAAKSAFKFGESSAAINGAGAQYLVNIATAAGSTANPLNVATRGVDTIVVSRTGDVTITALNGTAGSSTTGSAVSITAGQGAINSDGGAVTIASGDGGATSGAAGAVNITAGSATSANGASVTITAGSGAGGTNAGGNINLVPGAAVSTGTPGEVQVAGNSGLIALNNINFTIGTSHAVFIASRPCRVKAVSAYFDIASTSGTLNIFKDTGTAAIGGGTSVLTGTISLSGAARTVVNGTLVATVATLTLAAGDRISFVTAGTAGSFSKGTFTVVLAPC